MAWCVVMWRGVMWRSIVWCGESSPSLPHTHETISSHRHINQTINLNLLNPQNLIQSFLSLSFLLPRFSLSPFSLPFKTRNPLDARKKNNKTVLRVNTKLYLKTKEKQRLGGLRIPKHMKNLNEAKGRRRKNRMLLFPWARRIPGAKQGTTWKG